MRRLPPIIAAMLGLACSTAVAQGVPCGDGAQVVAHLEKDWGEAPVAMALDASGGLVRIYANSETGTWTMLVTRPGGLTCLIRHGAAWEPVPARPDPGDPS